MITPQKVMILGMELEQWTIGGCVANFGVGTEYSTLYYIETDEADRNKGYASQILQEAKEYYEKQGMVVGGTVPLNGTMEKLYKKFGYKIYS